MSNQEIPEKLIEEIAGRICKVFNKWLNKYAMGTPGLPNNETFAEELITRIAQAIKGGELDEWLGIDYRQRFRGYDDVTRLFLACDDGDGSLPGSRHYDPPITPGEPIEVIAFRHSPEEKK